MTKQTVFVFDPQELRYFFGEEHPFNPKRLALTIELLRDAGALKDEQIMRPQSATDEQLASIHSADYIRVVQGLSRPSPEAKLIREAERFGLHTEDTPIFPDMHEITRHIVGGSIAAADAVMSGRALRALHLGGGLHHAMPHKGSGFCVYNDAAVAIAHLRQQYGARVLYVDTDVHHGDGVQWSFYTDPDVCTFSIHETGKFLFPGTGGVAERGEGDGFGTTINMPVEPYTEDESWLECFEELLRLAIERFRPDVIVTQHGCDAHAYDPLAHIHCSMAIYRHMPKLIRELADRWCEGRWVALGGGGYDIWRVVPRAWSHLWLILSEHPLAHQLDQDPSLPLPKLWVDKWQPEAPIPLPSCWLDPVHTWEPMPRRAEITAKNRQTKEHAALYLR